MVANHIFTGFINSMNINSTITHNLYSNVNFKGYNSGWNTIGYDTGTEDARDFLMRKHSQQYLNDWVYDENLGKITEKEEDQTPYEDKKWDEYVDAAILQYKQRLDAVNDFQKASGSMQISGYKNAYRGCTLEGREDLLQKAKECGIKTVIDLCGFEDYEEDVEKSGMKYLYNNEHYILSYPELAVEEDIDDFTNVVSAIRKDNFFISCSMGVERTKQFLHIADLFNPDTDLPNTDRCAPELFGYGETLYNKLTPEQKEKMGWTEEYEDKFKEFIR